jgi:hypothetical protein
MYSHTFDTHHYIKKLLKSGLKEKQAEVIVKGMLQSREQDFSQAATKEFVEATKNELKVDIAASQNNILKWIIPLFLTNIGMVIAIIIKFLSH